MTLYKYKNKKGGIVIYANQGLKSLSAISSISIGNLTIGKSALNT